MSRRSTEGSGRDRRGQRAAWGQDEGQLFPATEKLGELAVGEARAGLGNRRKGWVIGGQASKGGGWV